MTDLKDLIEREIDQYLEWPTADKSHVTTVSAKLFAEHVATLYADHIPDAGKMVSDQLRGGTKKIGRPQIREVFLRNGAVIHADRDDLPDWVHESVFELLDSAIQQAGPAIQYVAPAVQGEPVEYQCHSCRKTTPPPAPFKAYVECDECGALTAAPIAVRLAAPQPAEQQPTIPVGISARTTFGGPQRFTTAEQQADPFRGDNVALIRSAQSLLSLDDKGAFGPNGIGGHARNIITAFIARISAEQQPAPDVAGLVEALEVSVNYLNQSDDERIHSGSIAHNKMRDALAAHRKQQEGQP